MKITFYIQARVDGGRRIGIEVDGETVLGRFDEGGGEFDPALLWYVDVRCAGRLPSAPDEARAWLYSQCDLLEREMRGLGQRLQVGLDAEIWPLQHKVEGAPRGVEITIVCSSLRSVASRGFGNTLSQLAGDLPAMLNSLGDIKAAA